MAVTVPAPIAQIVPIRGDAITVQLRALPDVPTEVVLHITRNGTREERFSLEELTKVLPLLQTLLGEARARSLNVPKKAP
jgi:hypothetical protein